MKNIRPIIEQLGFAEAGSQYGWHAFRHGVGTALWELTKDKLTVRDLLRHSTTKSFWDGSWLHSLLRASVV